MSDENKEDISFQEYQEIKDAIIDGVLARVKQGKVNPFFFVFQVDVQRKMRIKSILPIVSFFTPDDIRNIFCCYAKDRDKEKLRGFSIPDNEDKPDNEEKRDFLKIVIKNRERERGLFYDIIKQFLNSRLALAKQVDRDKAKEILGKKALAKAACDHFKEETKRLEQSRGIEDAQGVEVSVSVMRQLIEDGWHGGPENWGEIFQRERKGVVDGLAVNPDDIKTAGDFAEEAARDAFRRTRSKRAYGHPMQPIGWGWPKDDPEDGPA